MIVIAHRGASGYRPEHTLESYRLAIELGADYVEPDLVSTADGVLVARHENEIGTTTDVAAHPEFAARRTTRTVDGCPVTGWFTEDFTLAELKTLRARERLAGVRPHNKIYDDRFQVPTLTEIIALVRGESARRGRDIGIYPETKTPTYFRSLGLGLEEPLAEILRAEGLAGGAAKVYLQSFEPSSLQRLRGLVDCPLVQLIEADGRPYDRAGSDGPRSYADLVTPAGLRWIATYASAIGVDKDVLAPRDSGGCLQPATPVVADAHRVGLGVHAWTFRAENRYLPTNFTIGTDPTAWGGLVAELRHYDRMGVDAVFTDFPDIAVAARSSRQSFALA
ncbi:MAG TPA: glycerophosphodiester phosphodiesterase [Micromonosporaceae bacterium]|nr:glycerophosphodiester phosphodiesterase [Micromonosporaceae bacterium]